MYWRNKLLGITLICVIHSTTLATCDEESDSQKAKRTHHLLQQDAVLYPGDQQQGIRLRFSDEADWSDLWSAMSQKGFYTLGTLCVSGAFILYDEPMYTISKPESYQITAGYRECTPVSTNTKSIQSIGSNGDIGGSSITFFNKLYFASPAFPTMTNVGSNFFTKMEFPRSAIIIGTEAWTIEMTNGNRLCLTPDFDPGEPSPICLIPSFNTLLDTTENITIQRATQGCDTTAEAENIYKIQDCRYWGSYNGEKNNKTLIEDGGSGATGIGDCSGDSTELFKLYKAAILKNFDAFTFIGWAKVGKHVWKLELLDMIFSIVSASVQETIVPMNFFNKVREIFVRKLAKQWEQGVEDEFDLSEREYRNLMKLTEKCELANHELADRTDFAAMWQDIKTASDFDDHIDEQFLRNKNLDYISETVWLLGHMAGYICHTFNMHSNNFWAWYFHAFYNLYMLPIVSEWKKPQMALPLIFGGTNHVSQYKKLAMFTSQVYHEAAELPPLERPPILLLEPYETPV